MTKEKKPKIHRQKTYDLTLTKLELLHIRDLFGVLLPPDGNKTLSQALAELEDRSLIETMLWQKVSHLCSEANLPLNNEAPDYIVAPVSTPQLGVFHINHDMQQNSPQSESGFLPESEEQEVDEDEDE
jgi:hypothetical protein